MGTTATVVFIAAFAAGALAWGRVRVAVVGPIVGTLAFGAVVAIAWLTGLIHPAF